MIELFLKYEDEKGDEKRAQVEGEKFVVGRHTETDLCIPDGRLSRQHLKIDRFADVFVASDAGSSNGTTLNGKPLKDPEALKHGDIIELGGLMVLIEIETDDPAAAPEPEAEPEASVSANGVSAASQPAAESSSTSTFLFVLIPVFGLILVLFTGVIVYLLVSGPKTTIAKKQDDFEYSDVKTDDDDKPASKKESGKNDTNSSPVPSGSTTSQPGSTSADSPTGSDSVPTGKLTETAKIEQNGGAFLRRIAQNDPRAFLTSEQAQILNSKVKQLSGSSAVADNLKSAGKNSSQLKTLAAAKNLKPQFLAIAAVAKLGSNRGDVMQTAQGMTEVLDKLSNQIGNELADDSLLVVAAYGQGTAGDFMKLRNMLQDLSNKFPESSRAIRTIWFLQKNGKITQTEYENALTFLAIGTISQNPKDFGVNAEALAL
ncbi:MAG: FHA domain-containing protein [Pyrinomonadaceae bacterium]